MCFYSMKKKKMSLVYKQKKSKSKVTRFIVYDLWTSLVKH